MPEKKSATIFQSKIAEHISLNKYIITRETEIFLKNVRDTKKLNMAESLEIDRTQKNELLNRDQDNSYS